MKPSSTKQACLDDLKTQILTLGLAPGADLDEAALCDRYRISRTPLREVFQRLSGDGYVTLHSNRGAKVASMDMGVMRVFFQTAPLIYANIARLAAENRTSRQLDALRDIQRRFRTADPAAAAMLNHQFHALIGDMAANPYLMASLTRLLIDHTRLSQTFYRPASSDEAALVTRASEQHDAMITALESRESALMMDLTLQHWDLSRDRIERYVRPDPLPVDVIPLMDKRHAL